MAAVTRPAPAAARIIPVFGNTGETDYNMKIHFKKKRAMKHSASR
jgi:hypothetical protein